MPCCRKICRRPYAHKCQKAFPKDKTLSKIHEECVKNDNFILVGTKYIINLYHSVHKSILADDFLKSVVASLTLFTIGVQLTRDTYFSKLPPIFRCDNNFIDTLYITSL